MDDPCPGDVSVFDRGVASARPVSRVDHLAPVLMRLVIVALSQLPQARVSHDRIKTVLKPALVVDAGGGNQAIGRFRRIGKQLLSMR